MLAIVSAAASNQDLSSRPVADNTIMGTFVLTPPIPRTTPPAHQTLPLSAEQAKAFLVNSMLLRF